MDILSRDKDKEIRDLFHFRKIYGQPKILRIHLNCNLDRLSVSTYGFTLNDGTLFELGENSFRNKGISTFSGPKPSCFAGVGVETYRFCNNFHMPAGLSVIAATSNSRSIVLATPKSVTTVFSSVLPIVDIATLPGPHYYGGVVTAMVQQDDHTIYYIVFQPD
ncbi:hypothetical protein [Sphingomonas citri]|uniref:hypothetical protein n=1 Tax=Sphingomonas citri TaxID=2862499 RepID=UPI001CA4E891|nr:hypothetical protein [Sphingomonas citri]